MKNQHVMEEIECNKLLQSLSLEIKRLDKHLMDRKFPRNDRVKRYALFYAAQCLDFSKALVALQDQEAVVSQYAIWRSLFEAYVRFKYLIAAGKDCKEIQIQRLQNLMLEAFKDELNGINDPEVGFDPIVKVERKSWLQQQIKALEAAGAKSGQSISEMLKVLTSSNLTNGWYPLFRMCSAKTHSRLTDLDRVYGQDCEGTKFPAIQTPDECYFIFENAQKFLLEVGSGVSTLWGEQISVT